MDTFKYLWSVITQPEQLIHAKGRAWNMSCNGKDALSTCYVLPFLSLRLCTHIIPGNGRMQYIAISIDGECRLPHTGNRDGTDALRSITLLHCHLNALNDCSPYVLRVKVTPFRHRMARYGATAADSTDTPAFYIEN